MNRLPRITHSDGCMIALLSQSPEQTDEFGRLLAGNLRPGDVVSLDGDLGAGKTALTRGLAAGLG